MPKSLSLQRSEAEQSLPEHPLLQGGVSTSELLRWEVVLAYNLYPPERFLQDFWWLEVLAEGEEAAREVAREWVNRHPDKSFECTDWIRRAGEHTRSVSLPGEAHPLPIQWHVPLPENWPIESPIRHPATGRRLGFRDPRPIEKLGIELDGQFALVRHLPSSRADLVCLLPVVRVLFPKRKRAS